MFASGLTHSLELVITLSILLAPMVTWAHAKFRGCGFRLSDDLIWWVAALQSAALITLWAGSFRPLPFLSVYALAATVITVARTRTAKERASESPSLVEDVFILSLVGAMALTKAPFYLDVPKGGDALAYHLPMAAQWVQTQSFLAHDSRLWFYPGGYESITAIFFVLTGNDSLWFVPDLLAWAFLACSTYTLLQLLGVGKMPAALLVGALLFSPVAHRAVGAGDNDLWIAGLAISATAAILRWELTGNRQAAAAGLICLGALAWSKYTVLPWVLAGVLYVGIRAARSIKDFGALETVALTVFALLLGSFPARNGLLTGNPFFPLGFGSLIPWGDTSQLVSTLHKITPEEMVSSELIRQPLDTWFLFFDKLFEFATPLPVLFALAVVLNAFEAKAFALHRADFFVLAACVLGFGIFAAQPFVVENVPGTQNQLSNGWSLRFALPWILMLSTLLFAKTPIRQRTYIAAGLFALTIWWDDLYRLAAVVLLVCAIIYIAARFARLNIWHLGVLPPIALAFVAATAAEARPWQAAEAYTYGGQSEIASWVQESHCSQVIVSSTALRAWPLIGSKLMHRVISVGMSLPAEEFKRQAELYNASVVVVSKEDGDMHSATFGTFPPESQRVARLLGPAWAIGYNDGFAVAFIRRKANDCRDFL